MSDKKENEMEKEEEKCCCQSADSQKEIFELQGKYLRSLAELETLLIISKELLAYSYTLT